MSDFVLFVLAAVVFVLFFLKKAIHGKSICEKSKLSPPVREEPSKLPPPVREEPSKLPKSVREEPKLPISGLNLNAKEFILSSISEQPITPLQPVCKESQQSAELCVEWLTEGECEYGATCHNTNSHTLTNKGLFEFLPENICIFFVLGVCTRENCRFVHDESAINKKWNQPELSVSTTSSIASPTPLTPKDVLLASPIPSNPSNCWYCDNGKCTKKAHLASKPVESVPKSTPLAPKPISEVPSTCWYCDNGKCTKKAHLASKPVESAPKPTPSAPKPTSAVPSTCWYCDNGKCTKKAHLASKF